jgi:hypothetical protein
LKVSAPDDDLPIALTGRVHGFVDATRDAVSVGDVRTTSNAAVLAMKLANVRKPWGIVA